jgi:signal transduction histidine kinase
MAWHSELCTPVWHSAPFLVSLHDHREVAAMTGVASNSARRNVEPSDSTLSRGLRLIVRSLWVYTLVLLLWLTDHWRQSTLVEDVSNWAAVPVDLVALALLGRLLWGGVTHGVRWYGWGLLFLSIAFDLLATLAWTFFGATTPYLYRVLDDLLYQLYYPLIIGAFALFFLSRGGSFRRPQLWLDAVTVMLSMLAAMWAILYESPLAAGADPAMSFATKLSYTLGISCTMTMTVLLFMQITDWRSERATMQLIGAAVAGLVGDVAWLGVTAGGSAVFSPVYTVGDSIFSMGDVVFGTLVAGAAAAELRRPHVPRTAIDAAGDPHGFWPALALLLAIALLAGSEASQRGFDVRIMVALVLLSAVLSVVRHRVARYELGRLNRDLAATGADARSKQLRRSELARLSRMSRLSELSVSIGHEINQPLQSILSNAQAALLLLATDNPDLDEIREILQDIVLDDRRAGEIIRELRARLKKDESPFEALDLNELVHNVLRLLHSELLSAGVSVTIKLAPELPSIKGQRIQLQQVLLNLVVNGCESMAEVPLESRELCLTTQKNDDKSVLVCVTDRGQGIPPQDQERVFDAFFTTKNDGLGLGLSVSRLIISSHGGRLWAAASRHGPGACFCFTVPQY